MEKKSSRITAGKVLGYCAVILSVIIRYPGSQDSLAEGILIHILGFYRRFYGPDEIRLGVYLLILCLISVRLDYFFRARAAKESSRRQRFHRWKNDLIAMASTVPVLGALVGLVFFWLVPIRFAFAYAVVFFVFLAYRFRKDPKKLLALALLILLLFWSPYVFKGQSSHVKIFDNLDHHFVHAKVLAESGLALSLNPRARLNNYINGLPLAAIDSGFNVLTWLLMLFPPFTAYALNDLLIRLCAFFGMFLLLRRFVIRPTQNHHNGIVVGSALCFSLLPFYPSAGLSIAGVPLLLYVMMTIRKEEARPVHYLFLFFFPFYSRLALAGIFILFFFVCFLAWDSLRQRQFNVRLAGAFALLCASYFLSHFQLIHAFFDSDYVSFRQEIKASGVNTAQALRDSLYNVLFDRTNIVSAQHLFIAGAAVLAAGVKILRKIEVKYLGLLGLSVLFTSFLWGFKYWDVFLPLRDRMQIFNAFNFFRFYWFNPVLWALIFSLSLLTLSRLKAGRFLVPLFLSLQVVLLFSNYNWEFRSLLNVRKSLAGSPLSYSLSFKEFYSVSLFRDIDEYIQIPKRDYRVVSIGIHPGIANYNGFYTLDIYTDYYPLEYKHRFREVMAGELKKNPRLERGFDTNAKRCYVLVNEVHGKDAVRGMAFARGLTKKDQYLKVKDLDLNTSVLKSMGCQYIFSAVEILNFLDNGLSFEHVFERDESPWKIYLYRID